jgi:hypothetical protein
MANLIEIPISLDPSLTNVVKPGEGLRGDRRLVRFLPTPFGSREAIWISPYETIEHFENGPEKARKCIVLLSKGPPKPDIAVITIPSSAIDKFPLVPVEW